jgi:hypothetical protein
MAKGIPLPECITHTYEEAGEAKHGLPEQMDEAGCERLGDPLSRSRSTHDIG